MPNWKKLIVSGSNAVLSSLTLSGGITSSGAITAPSFTGSLFGTASNAVSSSYALTASFALNAGGGSVDFTEITTNQTLVLGTNYLTNNATKLVLTLPTGSDLKPIRVASKLGGWRIEASASWGIKVIDEEAQSIESNLVTDAVELIPIGGNLYSVLDINGNITFNL
jgi:hypothetical protein